MIIPDFEVEVFNLKHINIKIDWKGWVHEDWDWIEPSFLVKLTKRYRDSLDSEVKVAVERDVAERLHRAVQCGEIYRSLEMR